MSINSKNETSEKRHKVKITMELRHFVEKTSTKMRGENKEHTNIYK